MLWTEFRPDVPDPEEAGRPDQRWIEQRWFPGAHANVGGGYRDDPLPNRPLIWLQQQASACGLAFRQVASPVDSQFLETPRDSYDEFLGGLWPLGKLEWAGRTGRNLEALIVDPAAQAPYTGPVVAAGIERREPGG